MMITIHGLSPTTKYVDVKMMIKRECNIDDYILDNMVTNEDGTKKVRIGLANESEGFKLIKCLNGYHMPGNYVVKVSPVGKSAHSNNHGPSGQLGSIGQHGPSGPHGPGGPRGPSGQQGLLGQRGPGSEQGPGGRGPGAHGPGGQHMPGGQRGVGGPRGPGGQRGPGGEHSPVVQRGPGGDHSLGVQRGPSGPNKAYGSGGHHSQAPIDNMRPSLWVSNNTSNQWAPNHSITSQTPQNATYNFGSEHQQNASSNYIPQISSRPDVRHFDQGRQGPLPEQSYGGYQPKGGILPRPTDQRHNLRNIDIREGSNQAPSSLHGLGGRFPPNQYQQDKPMTIMKENFQGPTPFNITIPDDNQPQYQHRGGPPHWNPQGQQSQSKPQMNKPYEDRKYAPVDQQRYAKDPQPETYKEYEKRRGYSPKSRDPMPRRVSPRREDMHREPSGRMSDIGPRRASPMRIDPSQRRGSPPGRRDDPHGRRYSPSKRSSPIDRRNVSGHSSIRHESPHKRASPNRRLVSPSRRNDRPIPPRYSPGRHHSDKIGDKFGQDMKDVKKVRPAYEPPAHASNQAMYSGGFRSSNAHDNVQYAGSGKRQEQPSSWQRRIDDQTNPMKKHEDERRDSRMQINRERVPDQPDKRYSPSRKSRSPIRRDRSPIRDRFKRNSPSPRSSYSPRRSWALEKRSSPDAPPPPVWPGHHSDRDHARPVRSNFPEKDEKPKHQPVWEGRSFKEEELRNRRPEDRQRAYDEAKIRVAREVMERQSMKNAGTSERYQLKFSPRNDYEKDRDNYSRRDLPDRKPHADDFDLPRRPREEDRFDDYNRRRASPRHEMKVETPKDFDKDFEDIYNRTLQFKKRTEELRKSSSRKRDDFDDNRRHSEKIPGNERQRYEDRGKYREDDSSRQKREKAIEEITQKILDRSEDYKHVQGEQKRYILAELKQIVTKIVYEMFGDSDVSFIEIIIKYQARYNLKDEAKILQDAIRSLPKEYRAIKRHAPESADIPAKTNRVSPGADLKQGGRVPPKSMKLHRPHMMGNKPPASRQIQQSARPAPARPGSARPTPVRPAPSRPTPLRPASARPGPLRPASVRPTLLTRPVSTRPAPVKPAPAAITKEGKVTKEELQRPLPKRPEVNKPAPNRQAINRPEPKKPETNNPEPKRLELQKQEPDVTKEVKSSQTPEKVCGHYKLNALMTRMVDLELGDLMSKTWENLVDNTADEVECRYVETLRNEAGPDLRNVLGLNVTKRLLNVYNPFYVKVKFNGKPQKEELREFLKKYNFIGFARKAVNIFAAQVRGIDDFDRLCKDEEVKCGSVSVTVSPVYKFTTCPKNLKTKYKELSTVVSDIISDEELSEVEPKNTSQTSEVDNKNSANQANNSPITAKCETANVKEEKSEDPSPNIPKSVTSPNKSTQNKQDTEIPSKPTLSNEAKSENKVVSPPNPVTKTTTPQKETTVASLTKVTPVAVKTETKVTPTKTTTQVTPVKTATKAVSKTTLVKTAPKVTPTKVTHQKSAKTITSKDDEDDYDELDDHDILALMSEGIVLDECSASDGE